MREFNRVFVVRFPDRASKERFFADARYLEVRRRLFDNAVTASEIVAEYITE